MKFLKDGSFNNNRLLQVILFFTFCYISILWFTNILLYIEKMGFTYNSVVGYYFGSEDEFRNPVSYRGLLESTHFHLFTFALLLLLANHITTFVNISRQLKLFLIIVSFASGLGDIGAGWLIRFVSPSFAYLKIVSFIVFQSSLLFLLIFSFFAVKTYRSDKMKDRGEV